MEHVREPKHKCRIEYCIRMAEVHVLWFYLATIESNSSTNIEILLVFKAISQGRHFMESIYYLISKEKNGDPCNSNL